MNKHQFTSIRRSLTYQITEIKTILKRDSEIKDEDIKMLAQERKELEDTLVELEQSRRRLVLSYKKAKIARINNQGKLLVSEILTKKGGEVTLNPKVANQLEQMSKKVYTLDYLPTRQIKKKTKKKNDSLFD